MTRGLGTTMDDDGWTTMDGRMDDDCHDDCHGINKDVINIMDYKLKNKIMTMITMTITITMMMMMLMMMVPEARRQDVTL